MPRGLPVHLCGSGHQIAEGQDAGREQQHARPRGLANVIVELRQDFVDTPHGVAEWVERLRRTLDATLDDPRVLERGVAA